MIFKGSLSQLQDLVNQLGMPCRWQHKGAFQMAVFEDGASNLKLNWWPATGELQLVGDPEVRDHTQEQLQLLIANNP
jgi:hypothetical protein